MFTGLLAVASVLATSLAFLVSATPASAGVYQVIPADASGDLQDQFLNNDALFAYIRVDVQGGRVCVTDEDDTKNCDAPAFGEANTVLGIGTLYTLLEGPKLKAGTFRLRGEMQNPITKEWVEQTVSELFTVSKCVGVQCDSTIGAEAAAAFKAASAGVKDFTDATCLSFAVKDVNGAKGAKGKAKALDDADKQFGNASPSFGAVVGSVAGGIVLGFLPDLPTNQVALDLLKQISCMASQMYTDIKNDPPDPAFGTIAAPIFGTFPAMGTPEALAVAQGLDQQEAYGRAALHAYERYQGALAAHNQPAVRRQARAAANNSTQLVAAMRATANALRAHAAVLAADPETAGVLVDDAEKAQLVTVYQRVAASGFTAEEHAQLVSLGYTPAQIAAIRQHFTLPINSLPTGKTLAEVSIDLAAGLEANLAGIDQFARDAAAVADNDQPPLASFTTESLGSRIVRFTSTSSSPDGDPIAITWAFGDAASGTGTTVDHTYITDGTFTATVTATEPELSATASNPVVVGAPDPTNQAPQPSYTATPTIGVAPLAVSFDAAASVDPDGSITSYSWAFGDGSPLGTGVAPTHTFMAPGDFTVTLTVRDNGGAAAQFVGSIQVRNPATPPVITLEPPLRIPPGYSRGFSAYSDPQLPNQPLTFAFDFGDGSAILTTTSSSSVVTLNHIYAAAGTYIWTVTATNTFGASGQASLPVTVANVVADAGPDVTVAEGTAVILGGPLTSMADSGTSFMWDFGEGHGTPQGFDRFASHAFANNGTYIATLTVVDGFTPGNETSVDTVVVTVTNVAPKITGVIATSIASAGQTVSFREYATDAGVGDALSAAWDFGDGSLGSGSAVDHVYTANGTYTATVRVSDADGGTATATRLVTVEPSTGHRDSKGREFWLAFQTNYTGEPELSLFVSSDVSTSGFVEVPGIGFSVPFTVTAGVVTTVRVPPEAMVLTLPYGAKQPLTVHVVAKDEVTVYGLNRITFTTDAFLGLPLDVLGTDHAVVSYGGGSPSEIGIVATANGTTVNLSPKGSLIGEESTPKVFQLDAGDVVQIQGDDLTGSLITANHPVAVFGGNQCANIPRDVTFCDHITEQMPSTDLLGARFVTVPLATRLLGDTVRVVATQAATTVSINGTVVATIAAGEFYETILTQPSLIETSHPALVAQYSNGTSFDGVTSDPFMMLVPPAEQFLSSYTVAAPATGFEANFINVVAPTSARGSVQIDGTTVDPASWVVVAGTSFSGVKVPVALGSHTVVASAPIGVFVYGFDQFDSYGYPGGFQLARVGAVTRLTVSPPTQALTTGAQGCVSASVTDDLGAAVIDARVDFSIVGANPASGFAFTDATGIARICWTGTNTGTDTITVTIGQLSATATIVWSSTPPPVNQAPVAANTSVSTPRDTAVAVALAAIDADLDPLTFTVVTAPLHGTLSGSGNARTYTPTAGYSGPDSFTYKANDGKVDSNVATVSITVTPVNHAPIAADSSVSTPRDTAVAVALAAIDADLDPLTFAVVTPPLHGTLSGSGANLTYSPAAGYSGPDSFTYKANDGTADSNVATISITVTAVNHAPIAANSSASTPRDTAVAVALAAIDADLDALTFTVVTSPLHGALSGTGNTRTYTPAAGYSGPDSFTYKANDGIVDSNVATISITVTPVNHAPVAGSSSASTPRDVAVATPLTATDVDLDPLTYAVVTNPAHGTLSGTAPTLTYTPTAGYSGPDSFTYKADDGTVDSNVATVSITVTPVNHAPIAANSSVSTPRDTAVAVALAATDADLDPLTFTVVTAPLHGALSGTGNTRTYTPTAGYSGPDSFTYKANDGSVDSNVATISITVTPVNRAPVAANASVTTVQGTAVAVTLAASDVDGNVLTYTIVTAPLHGALSGTGNTRTYTPVAGYSGPDSFTYKANDGTVDSNVATISITVTPSTGCTATAPTVDVSVSSDQRTASKQLLSPTFSTTQGGELILAFISADGPTSPTQAVTSVTGGGLTWTLAARSNNTYGTAEVWKAYATGVVSTASVKAILAKGGYDGSIMVVAFRGAGKNVGAVKTAAGTTRAPGTTLTPTSCNSVVWAVGHDWSSNAMPTPRPGQTLMHTFIDTRVRDAYWMQRVDAPSSTGTSIVVGDTTPTRDRWQLAVVEIVAAG